ncbi:FUSC family protein [Kordia sp.]|uniref:FUSC family protein n=1 Tax=Kordia sp. TaxID=1965332 RepID=UPI003D2ACD4F
MSIFQKIFKNIPVELTRDKLRDAFRLALQSSIAAALAFTVMESFGLPEVFLAVLSAVLIVEPSIGDTFSNAKGRVLATIAGSIIGFIFISLIPWGFGTAISLLIGIFIMTGVASIHPSWRYGVVAVVAISLASEGEAIGMSLDRLFAIAIGIVVGLVCTAIIWPEKASKRANKHLRKALNAASKRFEVAYRNTKSDDKDDAKNIADDFHTSLGKAKGAAKVIRLSDTQRVFDQIDATEKLYNSILIIHRVAESADTTILDDNAGIKNDTEKLKKHASELIKQMVNRKTIAQEDMDDFSDLVEKIKGEVNVDSDNVEQNMFRHAFVFGITEIKESLQLLYDQLEDTTEGD